MFDHLDMTRFRGKRVAIATGGTSVEREISLATGRAFEEALKGGDYDVTVYDVATDLGAIVADRPDVILLGIHGGLGESGALQGFLESLAIPYTGSGVLASALAMDKDRTKIMCATAEIPVAAGLSVRPDEFDDVPAVAARVEAELDFPVVAKLNDSGSSFGVYLCADHDELVDALQRLSDDVGDSASAGVLVERYLAGPEYSVGFFDDICLGVMEITPDRQFYDFEAKYESGSTRYDVIDDSAIADPLTTWARGALEVLGCRGVARVDFKGDPTDPSAVGMLEVNTIPGMTATSLVPKLAANKGVSFSQFVEAMLAAARLDDEKGSRK